MPAREPAPEGGRRAMEEPPHCLRVGMAATPATAAGHHSTDQGALQRLQCLRPGPLPSRCSASTAAPPLPQPSQALSITLEKALPSVSPKFDYWRSFHPGNPDLEIDTHKIKNEDEGNQGFNMISPDNIDPLQMRRWQGL